MWVPKILKSRHSLFIISNFHEFSEDPLHLLRVVHIFLCYYQSTGNRIDQQLPRYQSRRGTKVTREKSYSEENSINQLYSRKKFCFIFNNGLMKTVEIKGKHAEKKKKMSVNCLHRWWVQELSFYRAKNGGQDTMSCRYPSLQARLKSVIAYCFWLLKGIPY